MSCNGLEQNKTKGGMGNQTKLERKSGSTRVFTESERVGNQTGQREEFKTELSGKVRNDTVHNGSVGLKQGQASIIGKGCKGYQELQV